MQLVDEDGDSTASDTALCLAFANTADWHASAEPIESLLSYNDLLAWLSAQQRLSNEEQATLANLASADPATAAGLLARAIELREAIYRIFVAHAATTTPAADDIACLNREVSAALPHLVVQPKPPGYRWEWRTQTDSVTAVLRPIALSAANLLTSARLERVKQCEDDRGCGFLFIDTSKNRSRRWCSMESCGNRAKVQRHRQRHG